MEYWQLGKRSLIKVVKLLSKKKNKHDVDAILADESLYALDKLKHLKKLIISLRAEILDGYQAGVEVHSYALEKFKKKFIEHLQMISNYKYTEAFVNAAKFIRKFNASMQDFVSGDKQDKTFTLVQKEMAAIEYCCCAIDKHQYVTILFFMCVYDSVCDISECYQQQAVVSEELDNVMNLVKSQLDLERAKDQVPQEATQAALYFVSLYQQLNDDDDRLPIANLISKVVLMCATYHRLLHFTDKEEFLSRKVNQLLLWKKIVNFSCGRFIIADNVKPPKIWIISAINTLARKGCDVTELLALVFKCSLQQLESKADIVPVALIPYSIALYNSAQELVECFGKKIDLRFFWDFILDFASQYLIDYATEPVFIADKAAVKSSMSFAEFLAFINKYTLLTIERSVDQSYLMKDASFERNMVAVFDYIETLGESQKIINTKVASDDLLKINWDFMVDYCHISLVPVESRMRDITQQQRVKDIKSSMQAPALLAFVVDVALAHLQGYFTICALKPRAKFKVKADSLADELQLIFTNLSLEPSAASEIIALKNISGDCLAANAMLTLALQKICIKRDATKELVYKLPTLFKLDIVLQREYILSLTAKKCLVYHQIILNIIDRMNGNALKNPYDVFSNSHYLKVLKLLDQQYNMLVGSHILDDLFVLSNTKYLNHQFIRNNTCTF